MTFDLKKRCQELVETHEIVEYLASVASGASVKQEWDTKTQQNIDVPAGTKDRIAASEMLLAYGYGKPPQAIDFTDHTPKDDIEVERLVQERVKELLHGNNGIRAHN